MTISLTKIRTGLTQLKAGKTVQHRNTQPGAAFLRIAQIIGNPNAIPPVPPLIPIGRSTWWLWVRTKKAPAPVKLGPRTTAWRSADIAALVESLNSNNGGKL